ncbi:MAG: stage III sporulation protein AA [Peptococcaceae bacterium]|nr:stage III sporulation protein AA [Peptococcaceae bacterium]
MGLKDVEKWFGQDIRDCLIRADVFLAKTNESVEEIRLRIGCPLLVRGMTRDFFVAGDGRLVEPEAARRVVEADVGQVMERVTLSSMHAAEESLRQGFVTLPGGHRVGVAGEVVLDQGCIRTQKNIAAVNFRIAKDPCRDIGFLLKQISNGRGFDHTLIVSPPRAGKTTLLRLLVKGLSNGVPEVALPPHRVGVVDERSEIAGMWLGTAAYDLGWRTDVLDKCPKKLGIEMLVRTMSPDVIAVDELGGAGEAEAVREAARCGVKMLATCHGESLDDVAVRSVMQPLLDRGVFRRVVVLSRRRGPGTLEKVHQLNDRGLMVQDSMTQRSMVQGSIRGVKYGID